MTDLTHDQLVDIVVDAMTGEFQFISHTTRALCRVKAGIILAAIAEATKEPTRRMIAGDDDTEGGDDVFPIARGTETHAMMGGPTPEKVWGVMHKASPFYPEKPRG